MRKLGVGTQAALAVLKVVFLFGSSHSQAIEIADLVQRPGRPTVAEVTEYLATHSLKPLEVRQDLPPEKWVDSGKTLHYNYPLWFQSLVDGAPKMIASFEKGFPGATWLFLGRDMATFADLFEAFYDQLGQSGRVLRIGTSRTTFDENAAPTPKLAVGYLETLGIYPKEMDNPVVFVDAVSRGGGRQGKYFVNAVFDLFKKDPVEYARRRWYFNFVGLEVSTTAGLNQDLHVDEAQEYLGRPDVQDSFLYPKADVFEVLPIFYYTDGRAQGTFLGTNEAGYAHWVGVWHGPYGPFRLTKVGNKDQVVTDASDLPEHLREKTSEIREAVLNYQFHIVQEAKSASFSKRVEKAAKDLGYVFPRIRPTVDPHTAEDIVGQIWRAKDCVEKMGIINQAMSQKDLRPAEVVRILENQSLWPHDQRQTLSQLDLEVFFQRGATPEWVNRLIELVGRNSNEHSRIMTTAYRFVKSKEEYRALIKPRFTSRTREYKEARRKFKEAHPGFTRWP